MLTWCRWHRCSGTGGRRRRRAWACWAEVGQVGGSEKKLELQFSLYGLNMWKDVKSENMSPTYFELAEPAVEEGGGKKVGWWSKDFRYHNATQIWWKMVNQKICFAIHDVAYMSVHIRNVTCKIKGEYPSEKGRQTCWWMLKTEPPLETDKRAISNTIYIYYNSQGNINGSSNKTTKEQIGTKKWSLRLLQRVTENWCCERNLVKFTKRQVLEILGTWDELRSHQGHQRRGLVTTLSLECSS